MELPAVTVKLLESYGRAAIQLASCRPSQKGLCKKCIATLCCHSTFYELICNLFMLTIIFHKVISDTVILIYIYVIYLIGDLLKTI